MQELNQPVLTFNSEVEFRDFLFNHGLSKNYNVVSPKFNAILDIEDCVPFIVMRNKAGHRVSCPDPNYYYIPAKFSEGYLNEPMFAGKRFVGIFNHEWISKAYRELYVEQCPNGSYSTVDVHIKNITTGQVAIFKKAFTWSDRNGENIFNNNLKTWLLWGGNQSTGTYYVYHELPDATSGCDFTFRSASQIGENSPVSFNKMNTVYGFLKV